MAEVIPAQGCLCPGMSLLWDVLALGCPCSRTFSKSSNLTCSRPRFLLHSPPCAIQQGLPPHPAQQTGRHPKPLLLQSHFPPKRNPQFLPGPQQLNC